MWNFLSPTRTSQLFLLKISSPRMTGFCRFENTWNVWIKVDPSMEISTVTVAKMLYFSPPTPDTMLYFEVLYDLYSSGSWCFRNFDFNEIFLSNISYSIDPWYLVMYSLSLPILLFYLTWIRDRPIVLLSVCIIVVLGMGVILGFLLGVKIKVWLTISGTKMATLLGSKLMSKGFPTNFFYVTC